MERRVCIAWALVSLLVGCTSRPPGASVLDAGEVGTLTQSARIVGRDGATSARLFGQEIWAFGDTFLAVKNAQGTSFVSNTFATSAGQVTDGGLTLLDRLDDAGAPDQLVQPTPDELAFDQAHQAFPDGGCGALPCGGRFATWPGAMVFDADGGRALIFYGLIAAAPGDFNFHAVGQSIAVWNDFASLPYRPTSSLCPDSPTLLFCQNETAFGASAVIVGGDLYAFGCNQAGLGFDCQLGRVPLESALIRSTWTFWTGSGWSVNSSDATTVFNGSSIMGVFFDAHVNLWMAVYAAPLGNQVVFRTAPALTGPWSDQGNLFTAQHGDAGGWTYDALPHPELFEQNGQVLYVTYSRPTSVFGSEFALVRVVLK